MKKIKLTQNKIALIDDEDFILVSQYKWYPTKEGKGRKLYAHTIQKHSKGFYMHCLIMNSKGIDHIDGNGLNNQKSNLRFATQSQNLANNRKFSRKCASKYKGVVWCKSRNKWQTQIGLDGKRIFIGRYNSEIEAALAYNKKAKEVYGEFSRLNIIEE